MGIWLVAYGVMLAVTAFQVRHAAKARAVSPRTAPRTSLRVIMGLLALERTVTP